MNFLCNASEMFHDVLENFEMRKNFPNRAILLRPTKNLF